MPSAQLIEAVMVTAELCGRTFSDGAGRVFVANLEGYREAQVLGALARCRKEVRGMLTLADVIGRLEDGHPGADEAWAIAIKAADENASLTWTNEIAEAWGAAKPVLDTGDEIGARMAFRDAYNRIIAAARRDRVPAKWWPSLGHDQQGREEEVHRAASACLLAHSAALMLQAPDDGTLQRLAAKAPPHAKEALLALRDRLAAKLPAQPVSEPVLPQVHIPTRDEVEGARGPDLMTLGVVAVKEAERVSR